jgi:hypothetical protein
MDEGLKAGSSLTPLARQLNTELLSPPTPDDTVDPISEEVTQKELGSKVVLYRGRVRKEVGPPRSVAMAMFRRPLLVPRPLYTPKKFRL